MALFFAATIMLSNLNEREMQVVHECLEATAHGPFFDECEFHTLMGLSRSEVAQIAVAWPNVDEGDENVKVAINNSLLNLTGYPHGQDKKWGQYISATPKEVVAILYKWGEFEGWR